MEPTDDALDVYDYDCEQLVSDPEFEEQLRLAREITDEDGELAKR